MDIHIALSKMCEGCKYTLQGNDISNLEWDKNNPIPKPTQATLNAWIVKNKKSVAIKMELEKLDSTLPRWAEDLLADKPVFGRIKEVISRKKELRSQL